MLPKNVEILIIEKIFMYIQLMEFITKCFLLLNRREESYAFYLVYICINLYKLAWICINLGSKRGSEERLGPLISYLHCYSNPLLRSSLSMC